MLTALEKSINQVTFQGKKSKKNDSDDQTETTPALKEHELFKKITEKHYCQACKTACVILDSGDHHILSHSELATWALLAVSYGFCLQLNIF